MDREGRGGRNGVKAANRVLYHEVTDVTHKCNRHDGDLQGVMVAGSIAVDIFENTFHHVRNIPVEIRDAQPHAGNGTTQVGHSISIFNNHYQDVGWSIPSAERDAKTGPVWWINNCVKEFSNFGMDWTNNPPSYSANRFGGSNEENGIIGIHRFYINVLSSSQNNAHIDYLRAWIPGGKTFAKGNTYWNNVWQMQYYPTDNNTPIGNEKVSVWSNSSSDIPTLFEMVEFDYNQYFINDDPNMGNKAFTVGKGFSLSHLRGLANEGSIFKENGDYLDPEFEEDMEEEMEHCMVINPITQLSLASCRSRWRCA